jgi:hypothetical protein
MTFTITIGKVRYVGISREDAAAILKDLLEIRESEEATDKHI